MDLAVERRALARGWLALVGLASMVGACRPELREGVYACVSDDGCPRGWVCIAERCYRRGGGPHDAALDAVSEADARADGVAEGGDGATDGPVDSGPPVFPCDPEEWPMESGAVFVLAGASGDGSSPATPTGSLASALPLTRAGRTRVYVGMGRYEEPFDVDAPVAGLVIDGGWDVRGAVWRRDCARGRDGTLFASPTAVGGTIQNAREGLRIRNVTIATNPFTGLAPEGMSGRSSMGLVVQGERSAV
ncbi:MAG: hypothetical protein RMK74_14280, partial [Myxococcales bacterium]|nr:hypothetical protein [Myxococcales bacterium]